METPKTQTEVDYEKTTYISRWIPIALIVVSLFGFADSSYLTAKHYQNEIPPCGASQTCETVLTSKYAQIAGAPVALGGAIFYLSILILTVFYVDTKKQWILRLIPGITLIGFLFSARFVYLMLFEIRAICWYCVASATSSTILFLLGILVHKHLYRENINAEPKPKISS